MKTCDVLVIGGGGVGTAALAELAGRGARAIALDRFAPGHDRGSSHGQTRIIRQAYFEHPDYVPLLVEAYRMWRQLEEATEKRLFEQVGLIEIGLPEGPVVSGVLASAREHGLDVEQLTARQIERRFTGLRVAEPLVGVFEPGAGLLHVERCVVAQAELAQHHGAELRSGETVLAWSAGSNGVEVQTDRERYAAGQLIVAAGAWAGQLLADLRMPLVVLRKALHWFRGHSDVYRWDRGMPTFLFDLPAADVAAPATELGNCFYGFPAIDERGVKVAEHTGGSVVDDPLSVDRGLDPADERRVIEFCRAHLPQLARRPTDHGVCMYTMAPDRHFVVDRHPRHSRVAFAAGLSGHGFKFVPVLGRILADLALDGRTDLPIEFLSARRPALTRSGASRD